MNPSTPSLTPAQLDAMQSRFALRVCARLDEASRSLPHDIGERLRVAREQAVAAAMAERLQTVMLERPTLGSTLAWSSGQVVMAGGGRPQHHGHLPREDRTGWGWRIAGALPVLALVAGLWGISVWHQREQIQATADVDVALLSDDLPPAAYADPGFEEFLQDSSATTQAAVVPVHETDAPLRATPL